MEMIYAGTRLRQIVLCWGLVRVLQNWLWLQDFLICVVNVVEYRLDVRLLEV